MTRHITTEVDVCVVGGGMAGLIAALAAARHGARVALMHDRPVLGGNASSECRVHICGADRHNMTAHLRETGILEELRLANLRHNPQRSFSVWDTLLYDACRRQPNLTLLLNCSANQATMASPSRIGSVSGWQGTSQTWQTVRAKVFIDASGDAILAPLTGAAFRFGREARSEYGESLAPEQADKGTMGMTVAFGARPTDSPQEFTPPPWARRFDRCEDLPAGVNGHSWWVQGYWWTELGGMHHSIHDTERVRDELLAVCLGIWDHIKNRCRRRDEAANWVLDWVQHTPAKRESRRYVGQHVLTQDEVMSGGALPDVVAYGGWTIDEHPPVGVLCGKLGLSPSYHASTPMPYGIPYGSLVARDIENLMFAGRCASASHIAMSSARVMGTGAVMGQAAGTAAALAAAAGVAPIALRQDIGPLQQALIHDDCHVPGVSQSFNELTRRVRYVGAGNVEPLRDGWGRKIGPADHAWPCKVGDRLEILFDRDERVEHLVLAADSCMELEIQMSFWQRSKQIAGLPPRLLKDATVEVLADGQWRPAATVRGNYDRLVRIPVSRRCRGVRLTLDATWGQGQTNLYAAWVE